MIMNQTYPDCNHEKNQCDCMCCCSISKIGCPSCIVPVLCYRQIKKLARKIKAKKASNTLEK